ncbi:MAG: UDP-N-acetylmuramoyl-tripeptide--D-alanyl-D-alanine ligase [bacterium]|nr:UDP-N-acetylmuramoyl-tripeptide--D-alanyl-D-alanine ligase [bacterium]
MNTPPQKKQAQRKLEARLAVLAREVLAAHKPTVVAITGSVGKTGTKDAIASVLKAHGTVRVSEGNYNNELGLPLAIFGERSPGKKLFGWWGVMRRARALSRAGADYPKMLVLEMGMDHPGDLAGLVAIAQPTIGVVTNIGESHLEFFESVDAIAKEKSTVVSALGSTGVAILNSDDPRVRAMAALHSGKTITFGMGPEASVRAVDSTITEELSEGHPQDQMMHRLQGLGVPLGTSFTLTHAGQSAPVTLQRMLGKQQIYAALAAAAVGIAHGMSIKEIAEALSDFAAPKGRMNLIPGVKDSLLIDDSYNSAPASAFAALDVLGSLKPAGRRIAVLGDMAELGTATEPGHQEVGQHAAHTCDFAIFVGPKSKFSALAAEQAGLVDERQTHVLDSRQVEAVLQSVMRAGDVVLVKGSQIMRMERVVKALMAEPERASELLVRQSEGWENNP